MVRIDFSEDHTCARCGAKDPTEKGYFNCGVDMYVWLCKSCKAIADEADRREG